MEWLQRKIEQSWYQQTAERYYRANATTNSLYFEITGNILLVYDGYDYKRGLQMGGDGLEMSEFARRQIENERLKVELACMICFARRARRMYDWNVIPVIDGNELLLRTR